MLKRTLSFIEILLCLLLLLTACAQTENKTQETVRTAASDERPEVSEQEEGAMSCSLTVRCDILLDHLSELEEGKAALVPEDGILLSVEDAVFTEGESVFDVLKRELQARRMHLEFSESVLYDSVYVEGICNLYEYDCGELSGWIYRVNGETFNYGCSACLVSDGDVIEWLYSCDLGNDL